MFKKIYTFFILILNFCIRRKHYRLHFIKKDNKWFYDFKWWGFDYGNLEMVSGADVLCELFSNGKNETTVDIIASKKKEYHPDYEEWSGDDLLGESSIDKFFWGRTYTSTSGKENFWICPVTLFVLGRYPNYLYIKNHG